MIIKNPPNWAVVSAIITHLEGARSITRVEPRHLGRGEVVLAIESTIKARQLVAIVRATKLAEGSLEVKSRGKEQIEVVVRGASE